MEKMELSEALKANASVLDICLSIKPNHWIINPIHQVIMDSWKRLLLMRSPSSKLL